MTLAYHPDVAAEAVMELSNALRAFTKDEYVNALLADPRMTSTKGLLASCGFSYRDIKVIREQVAKHLPTLESQRQALAFLNRIDELQKTRAGGN